MRRPREPASAPRRRSTSPPGGRRLPAIEQDVPARDHRPVVRDAELFLMPLPHGLVQIPLRASHVVCREPHRVGEPGAAVEASQAIAALTGVAQERAAAPCQLWEVTDEVAGICLVQLRRIELPGNAAALEQQLLGALSEPTCVLPPPLVERGDARSQLAQRERVLRLNPLGEGARHSDQLYGAPATGAALARRERRLQREAARDAVGLTRAQGEEEVTREEA